MLLNYFLNAVWIWKPGSIIIFKLYSVWALEASLYKGAVFVCLDSNCTKLPLI